MFQLESTIFLCVPGSINSHDISIGDKVINPSPGWGL